MINHKNQQNPPLPKRKRVDAQGNSQKRIFAKSGTATLEIAKMPSDNAVEILLDSIKENVKRLGGTVSCTFFGAR